jgi:hypothetical protein
MGLVRERVATPFHVFCPRQIASYPASRIAPTGNSTSVAFSSCKQTTSGLDSRIQSRRLGRRFLTLLMLNVAIFIFGADQGMIVNLTDHRAEASRKRQLDLLSDLGPHKILCELSKLDPKTPEPPHAQAMLPHLVMPAHHDVRATDIHARRLHGNLAAAAERALLLTPGVGARTVKALAMVAEVVHGAPCRFSDPARFSLAHGGKDRHPLYVASCLANKRIC